MSKTRKASKATARTPAAPSWRVTSVSGSPSEAASPSVLELQLPAGVRVIIHRWHGLDGWYVACRKINVDRERLDAVDLVDAQKEAIAGLAKRAREIATTIESFAKGER